MRHAVIMAGGVGTRLWPISRQATPKQFQKLTGDQSLFQQTFNRLSKVLPPEQIWVMTGDQYLGIVQEQLPSLPKENIITEPAARNTAAASGLAVFHILNHDPEATIALLASDHYVGKEKVFAKSIETAFQFAEQKPDTVTAVGIHPTSANTGYGYIKIGEKMATLNKQVVYRVDSFKEKPDQVTAEEYVESGQYLWNASYFIFNGALMAEAFEKYAPEMATRLKSYLRDRSAPEYETIPNDRNLDKVIIEKLDQLAVIPAEMEWSDIGDWAALHEILSSQGKNSEMAHENHIATGSVNTLVMGGNKLIATVGLKDVVVIDTDDVILVCHKDSVQDVKKIVEQLEQQGRQDLL